MRRFVFMPDINHFDASIKCVFTTYLNVQEYRSTADIKRCYPHCKYHIMARTQKWLSL